MTVVIPLMPAPTLTVLLHPPLGRLHELMDWLRTRLHILHALDRCRCKLGHMSTREETDRTLWAILPKGIQ